MTLSSALFSNPSSALHLEKLEALSIETSNDDLNGSHCDESSFQLPAFSEEDHILLELEKAGICNEEGYPTSLYEKASFAPLSSKNEEDRPTIKTVYQFLHEQRLVQSQTGHPTHYFYIPFSFFELLTYLSEVSQNPSQYQKTPTSFVLEEVELIGRYLIELLGSYPFIKTCKTLFPSLSHQRIDEWFSSSFIQDFFCKRTTDIDLRHINQGPINHQANLSQHAQIFFTDRLRNFHGNAYCQFLKMLNEKKYGFLHPSSYLVRKHSLLEFGGVTKRKIVKTEDNQYTIFGLKTNQHPFELIFVGKPENSSNQTGLKNTCLSSSNCWTASLIPFLDTKVDEIQLSINAGPFKVVQALIGLLTNSSFILDPSTDAWLRYLKDYSRSLQSEDIEQKMVQHLLKNKEAYLSKANQSKASSPHATSDQSIEEKKEFSHSHYLACLLEDEIKKHHKEGEQAIDPAKSATLLLRACLSIQSTHPFKDEEICHLWQLMEEKALLDFDQSALNHLFPLAIKQALIDKNIPFSIVSAWLGFLAHAFFPTSLTHHGRKGKKRIPVFCLKSPFSMRLPATAHPYVSLFHYLNEKGVDGFIQIYQSLTSFFDPPLYPSPIKDCLFYLGGDPQELVKWGDVCLDHSESFLQFMGAQLYFMAAPYQFNQNQAFRLFYALPSLLAGAHSLSAQRYFLHQLNQLTSVFKLSAYHQALSELEDGPLSVINWMKALMATKDSGLTQMADLLWRQDPLFAEERSLKKEMGLALFQAWSLFDPPKALIHLTSLIDHTSIDAEQALQQFLFLCKRFQECKIQLNETILIHFQILLNDLLSPSLTIDKALVNREELTKFTLKIISLLYQIPDQHASADHLLLKISELNFCNPTPVAEMWLSRLEQQCSAPSPCVHSLSVCFYEIEAKGFLKGLSIKDSRLQEFKIKLGMLLLNDHSALSQKMLEELIKNDLEPRIHPSLYEFLLIFLRKTCINRLATESLFLLKYLIQITPTDKRLETSELLQMVCQGTFVQSPREIIPQLDALDALLLSSNLLKEGNSWRKTLLIYLEKGAAFDYSRRFSSLWKICQLALNLPGKKSDHPLIVQTTATLLAQAETSSFSLPTFMENWLKKRYVTIVNYLNEQHNPSTASIFLKALARQGAIEEQSVFYACIWKTCQRHLSLKHPLQQTVDLLYLAPYENFKQHFTSNERAALQTLIDRLLAEKDLSSAMEAGRWIEACWPLIDQETDKQQNESYLFLCLDQLMECHAYQEAFSWLQISIPWISSFHRAQMLWLKLIETLQESSSLNQLNTLFLSSETQHLFKSCHSSLKEFAKKEIKKRLTSSSGTQDLRTLLDFFIVYRFQEGNLWLDFSSQLLFSQDKTLVEECFKAFQSEDNCLFSDSLSKVRCWENMFRSIYQVSPKGLLTYLDKLEDLKMLFSPTLASETLDIYRLVFLSAISELCPKEFNHALFTKICTTKKEFLANFQHESKPSTLIDRWSADLDHSMIQQLQTSSNPLCLEALCKMLHPYLCCLDEQPQMYGRFIGSTEKMITSYLALNLLPDHPLNDQIHSLLLQAECQNTFPTSSCYRILLSIKKHHINCLPYSIKLMHKIFTHGTIDQQLQLKQSLLALLPAAANDTKSELPLLFQLLESAFKIIKYSPTEKSLLTGHCLTQYLDRQLGNTLSLDEFENVMETYCEWAYYLFADPKILKEVVAKAAFIPLPFGSSEAAELQNQEKFGLYIKNILNVNYHPQIKNQATAYKESRKSYTIWCIQSWKELKICKDFLVASLDEWIYQEIIHASKKELPIETLLEELDEFIYFGPPEPPHTIIRLGSSKAQGVFREQCLQERSKKLVHFAIGMKIFDKRPEKLAEYSMYLNLPSSCETASKVAQQMASRAVEKFLTFDTSYSIFLSTQAFNKLQGLSTASDSKKLSTYIDQIGKASCKHPLALINKHTLFYYLYKSIPHSCGPDALSSEGKKYFSSIYMMQFQKIWAVYQEISQTASLDYQAYYLKLALDTLYEACSCQGEKRRWEDYLTLLLQMLPAIVRLDAIDTDRKTDKLDSPQCGELTSTFLSFFKLAMCPLDSASHLKDQKLISELFIKWLHSLMKIESEKEGRQAFRLICLAFTDYLDTSFFNHSQREAVACLGEMLEWMPKHMASYEHPNIEYLKIRFFASKLLKDYPFYLQFIKQLSAQILSKDVLTQAPGTIDFITDLLITRLPSTDVKKALTLRHQALISFINSLISTLERFEIASFSEASDAIIYLLEQGMDQDILTEENPEAIQAFEACCQWITSNPNLSVSPHLTLLRLEFYQQSQCKTNHANYYQQINSLMQPLKEQIMQKPSTKILDRFFKLVSKMPQANASSSKKLLNTQPGDLLIEWVKVLNEPCHSFSTWQELKIYTAHLYERASHHPVFKNHLAKILLIMTQN